MKRSSWRMFLITFLSPSPMIIKLRFLSLLIAQIFSDVVSGYQGLLTSLILCITSRMTFTAFSYYPSWALLERIYTDIAIEQNILSIVS